ncbi:MAG: chitobiase/beta-hexosaminidase C-terminal domain-containing protein [Spirochaetaceae bacterium]|nr:chitobiase/beta-hexosaminidase C-terminal domain-containing protein [Spirochaetaceae bacterium]
MKKKMFGSIMAAALAFALAAGFGFTGCDQLEAPDLNTEAEGGSQKPKQGTDAGTDEKDKEVNDNGTDAPEAEGGSQKPKLVTDIDLTEKISVPAAGGTATGSFSSDQYTGVVSWSPALSGGRFAATTDYAANVTLTAEPGYTFSGVRTLIHRDAKIGGMQYTPGSSAVTIAFPTTLAGPSPVTSTNLTHHVPAPVAGITAPQDFFSYQYWGTVEWYTDERVRHTGPFAASTAYMAEVTLYPEYGWTLTGASGWTHSDALHGGVQDIGNIVTINFPATSYLATIRYEPVPLSNGPQLLDSAMDEYYFYYIFLLGHINHMPLTSRTAVVFDGVTPVTIEYSNQNITETSIGNSVSTAQEYSVTKSSSYTLGWSFSWGLNDHYMEGAVYPFVMSYGLETEITTSTDIMEGRSIANTYETLRTESIGHTDTISFTVGEHGEPPGKYRFSRFATCDVYAVIVTNHTYITQEAYLSYSARKNSDENSHWKIDYDPDLNGTFGKTALGDLLKAPGNSVYFSTPVKSLNDMSALARAATPEADMLSDSYETSVTVTLSCATEDASIYYTTDGSRPRAENGRLYTGAITLSTSCTLKASAIADGVFYSDVMEVSYTVKPFVLQTGWKYFVLTGTSLRVDSGQPVEERVNLKNDYPSFRNFDLAKLKAAGYKYIKLSGYFQAWPLDDSYIGLTITATGTGTNSGRVLFQNLNYDPDGSEWHTLDIPKTWIPIEWFGTEFKLTFSSDGLDPWNRWSLGYREVIFEASTKNSD